LTGAEVVFSTVDDKGIAAFSTAVEGLVSDGPAGASDEIDMLSHGGG